MPRWVNYCPLSWCPAFARMPQSAVFRCCPRDVGHMSYNSTRAPAAVVAVVVVVAAAVGCSNWMFVRVEKRWTAALGDGLNSHRDGVRCYRRSAKNLEESVAAEITKVAPTIEGVCPREYQAGAVHVARLCSFD